MATAEIDERGAPLPAPIVRTFAWTVVGAMFVYLINCYLSFWQDWPGILGLIEGTDTSSALAWAQVALYAIVFIVAVAYVLRSTTSRSLRDDAASLNSISVFIICAAFWSVLLIGLVDAFI